MTTDLTKFSKIEAGLAQLAEDYGYTKEKALSDLALVDGEKSVKESKKKLTSTRTAITKAAKDAKAPLLKAQRAINAKEKELIAAVKKIEQPIDEAIAEFNHKAEEAAAQAQAQRIAELEAQLAEVGATAEAKPIPQDKVLSLTIRTKEQAIALASLIGREQWVELVQDEHFKYEVSVTIKREGAKK